MTIALGLVISTPALAQSAPCGIPGPVVASLQSQLAIVVASGNGGLFTPNRMWSAVVDRQGVLCSVIRNDPDAWPGGPVAVLVGIEGGVVSEVINLESSGVGAPDRRPRHDQRYHEVACPAV